MINLIIGLLALNCSGVSGAILDVLYEVKSAPLYWTIGAAGGLIAGFFLFH